MSPSRSTEGADTDSFEVAGRGELQLAVLIETMRREGFELDHRAPARAVCDEENGQTLEPIEEVIIDVDDEYSGVVVQKLTERKGDLVDMRPSGTGRTRLRLLRADPRPDRLSARAAVRHARHRRSSTGCSTTTQPYQGRAAGPPHRRADLQCRPASPWPMRCGTSRIAGR